MWQKKSYLIIKFNKYKYKTIRYQFVILVIKLDKPNG